MNIWFMHDRCGHTGGAERTTFDLHDALVRRGHSVLVVAPEHEPDGHLRPALRLPTGYGWRSAGQALRLLDTQRLARPPDLIHLHNTDAFLGPRVMDHLTAWGLPTIKTVHDVRPLCAGAWKMRVGEAGLCAHAVGAACWRCVRRSPMIAERGLPRQARLLALKIWEVRALRRFTRVIAPSPYLERELARNGIPPDRIRGMPWYRDPCPPDFSPPAGHRLLFVGRLVAVKGLRELLGALAGVRGDWALDVVGDGDQRADLERLATTLGLAPRVVFHGQQPREALAPFYRACRAVIIPTTVPEAYGLVGPEAFAHARPVVAFAAGGVDAWLEPGRTGLVCPRGDIAALAAAVQRLLEEPGLAATLGLQARAAAEALPTLGAYVDRLEALYRECL